MSHPTPVRVVLVDDSEDFRYLFSMALEREGDFEVVAVAGDGAAGVRTVREHLPDLVLLDIAMPVMDGLQALTLIREEHPDVTVVVLSAFGPDTRAAEQATDLGADGYVRKGDGLVEACAQIRGLVDRAQYYAGSRRAGDSARPATRL
jgi:DNA-binding NarL/FixJ family response regulator